jgi:inorganic phosphate transporter, PiT family
LMTIWFAIAIALAFFLAWNLGANDVANAMATSVGAGVVTLRQAVIIAGVMELAGAIALGHGVTTTLLAGVTTLPQQGDAIVIRLSMLAVLLANGLWLWGATLRGWPVASSHAAVSAMVGVSLVWAGMPSIHWDVLGKIGLSWVLTPLLSGAIAALYYGLIQHYLLTDTDPVERLWHWHPWLSGSVVVLIGSLVLPVLAQPLAALATAQWHWPLPSHDYSLGLGVLALLGVNWWTASSQNIAHTDLVEQVFGKLQLLSAGCMAFAHGSNDVGNAIAPLAAFGSVQHHGSLATGDVQVPLWMLGVGGIAIVGGLATLGKPVMTTVGEKLIILRPSLGFCAEIGAASTVLLASSLGVPVSTTHALIGSVVGVGLVQQQAVKWSTVQEILTAWCLTVPITLALAVLFFVGLRSFF